jgi:predicted PhzF superfamily epimerase YddE/YHI9
MERPGEVDVEVEVQGNQPRRIHISGAARVVFTTEIALD